MRPPNYRETSPDCCLTCVWGREGDIVRGTQDDYECLKHYETDSRGYRTYAVVDLLGLCDDYRFAPPDDAGRE